MSDEKDPQRISDAADNCEVLRARLAKYEDAEGRPIGQLSAFNAGVKAASDKVKSIVADYDEQHGSTDPDTGMREYPGNGEEWVGQMMELIEDFTGIVAPAALKAQPRGVVLPPENTVMRIVLREMGGSAHVRGTSNWCADVGMAVVREVARLNSSPASLNQCDGCRAGIPVENGMHAMGIPGGYADKMMCTASRYESAPSHGEQVRADAERFNKLLGWMSSNVADGWNEVCRVSAVATYVSHDEARAYLDDLPQCSVGLAAAPSAGSQEQGE
jgi:hypothetical protein